MAESSNEPDQKCVRVSAFAGGEGDSTPERTRSKGIRTTEVSIIAEQDQEVAFVITRGNYQSQRYSSHLSPSEKAIVFGGEQDGELDVTVQRAIARVLAGSVACK